MAESATLTAPTDMLDDIDMLKSREQIKELSYRYARGVDRGDIDTLKSAYWPDAEEFHGFFNGLAWDFAEFIVPMLRKMPRVMHHITNTIIQFDGLNSACGETYCMSFHEIEEEGAVNEVIGFGRYLDRFERRNGEWRIARRTVVQDWNQKRPTTSDFSDENPLFGQLFRGQHYPHDLSYEIGLKVPQL